jgi:polyhydroxybutyrate depolymerase
MPDGKKGLFSGNIAATPSWNSGMFTDLNTDPNGPDEVSFFKQMVKMIEEKYPIDTERVYVTGHSNGSMMTQRLMRCWPEKFAGFAPVGFMEGMIKVIPEPEDGIIRNVWYAIGEYDGMGIGLDEQSCNYKTILNLCAANKVYYSSRRYYVTGIYMNRVIRDSKGVPLVRFTGIRNWPHTYSASLRL